jgi:hypothetical protein
VLGAIVVFEIVGPLAARFALDRSGESRPQDADPLFEGLEARAAAPH